jgi:hypothetical protein
VKANASELEILIVGKVSWVGEIGWKFGLLDVEGFFG